MAHIIRRTAKQGHPVDAYSHAPYGPFNPDLFAQSPIVRPEPQFSDEEPLYECAGCEEILTEQEISDHSCS